MLELDHKEGWALKNWCLPMVLEKMLESPLDCKEIQPVNLKGNKHWIFIGRTDAEAEAPIYWLPDAKSQLTGKDWRQKEKGTTEDEMVGWHHWLSGHKFEQTMGDREWQGSLGCYSPWGHKELDTTERLNTTLLLASLWQGHPWGGWGEARNSGQHLRKPISDYVMCLRRQTVFNK